MLDQSSVTGKAAAERFYVRRTFLKLMGLMPMVAAWAGGANSTEPAKPLVKPRHVLCFLGGEHGLAGLANAASAAIDKFATGFSIDHTYSLDESYPRMSRSFEVCWDRVQANAWTSADEEAVANHKSVLYVLGPPMTADTSVTISTAALFLVDSLMTAGAVAVKGESAGVAHGLARWRQLAHLGGAALKSDDHAALSRVCRLAFAKRPLESEKYIESVGFHLVGLPEIYLAKIDEKEMDAVTVMDAVADELTEKTLEAVLRDRKATLSFASAYKTDDFKFNPYGIVYIEQR
jgi:hypothetical protein